MKNLRGNPFPHDGEGQAEGEKYRGGTANRNEQYPGRIYDSL